MKKGLVILAVLVMAAPLYAGTITFTATDNGDGTCNIDWVSDVAIVAMALDVDVTVGPDEIGAVAADSFFNIYMDAAYDDPCSYGYGDGTPIADQDIAGEIALPSSSFCISMGGLGGESEPLNDPCTSGTITLTANGTGTAVTVTIGVNALRGGVIDEDGAQVVSNLPIAFDTTAAGCMSGHADEAEYLAAGSPSCWCYKYQCHGDTDNIEQGTAKDGYYWVSYADLTLLAANWQLLGDSAASGDYPSGTGICADFDRSEQGTGKDGYFRVTYGDLTILGANWQGNSEDGPGKDLPWPPDCGGDL